MPAILLTPPASEPLSLAEAKNFLRVEHDADDELIAALIASARGAIEQATRRVLITQTWRIVLDRAPASGRIVSPVNPLRTLEAARVLAEDGAQVALDLDSFTLNTAAVPGVIAFERVNVAQPGRALAGIELDVTAGYGGAADVPAPLLHAIRLLRRGWKPPQPNRRRGPRLRKSYPARSPESARDSHELRRLIAPRSMVR